MSVPTDLIAAVHHYRLPSPQHDLMLRMAQEIQSLKTKVRCNSITPVKATPPAVAEPPKRFTEDDVVRPEQK